ALSQRLRVPIETLNRLRRQLRRPVLGAGAATPGPGRSAAAAAPAAPPPIRPADLDRTDLELIRIVLNEPASVAWLIPRVAVGTLRDAPLRAILQACYELHDAGEPPSYENLMVRLDDPVVRGLATDLITQSVLRVPEPGRFSEGVQPASWPERLQQFL